MPAGADGLIWGVLSQKLHETTHKEVPLSILNLSVGLCNFVSRSCTADGDRVLNAPRGRR